jgi:hypothetical protein
MNRFLLICSRTILHHSACRRIVPAANPEENGMKILQLLLVALLAIFSYFALPQAPAKADHLRWMLPGYFPPPPPRRVYRYYPDVYEDDYYGDDFDAYDDEGYSYYEEPELFYQPPPRKKKRSTASAPSKVKPQAVEKPKKKPTQTASAPVAPPKPEKATPSAKTTASSNVSCDKAKSIVTGFGFSNIQTQSCSGSVYSFAASRGGKSFSVKVSALNGELTEVKRQ